MRAPRKAKAPKPIPASLVPGPAPEEDTSAEVLEFLTAIDAYKRKNQRPFPSWTEVLVIVKQLGYEKHRKSA
jgi:hypothetical protein